MTEQKQIKLARIEFGHEPVEQRIKHFNDFTIPLTDEEVNLQSRRCLNCGTPFCSNNCPLHNRPVDFNRLVREGKWRAAWDCLASTSPFPDFTSRVCPAICEAGCSQYFFEDAAVGIKTIERAIIDRAWAAGWVKPEPALRLSGKKVAVVGSGPAGLACAQQLARAGHAVTVYEKGARPGGLLRYGIPDFKLPKALVDRRLEQMRAEGVVFETGVAVGEGDFETGVHCTTAKRIAAAEILAGFDAVVIAVGAEMPRDLRIPGREGKGVHFALDLLQEQNRFAAGEVKKRVCDCSGCDVIIIGGGDTGNDCVGTARRQGAGKIHQVDISPCAPEQEDKLATWPDWPRKLRTSDFHLEGCERVWSTSAKEFLLDGKGALKGVRFVKLAWERNEQGRFVPREEPGSDFEIPAQRAFLAMGFLSPSQKVLAAFGVKPDARGNCLAGVEAGVNPFGTSVAKVFACGDARSGQSLVVRAMSEGRRCAAFVDRYLMGSTELPHFRA